MSHFLSKPTFSYHVLTDGEAPSEAADQAPPLGHTADTAIDAALRSVPLPDGLMTRLDMIVYTVPDEAADQIDWLGC